MGQFNNGAYDSTNRMANAGQIISFYSFTRGNEVSFKPFLKSFRDSYKSNWERKAVYGRPDPIHTYKNTQRTISLTWEVVAGSTQEGVSNLDRVSKLTQMLYPDYTGDGSVSHLIKEAPIMRIKFMNLITNVLNPGPGSAESMGLLATVDGFEYSVLHEYGFFSAMAGGKYAMLPKVIEISCTIHPMHEFTIGGEEETSKFPYGLSGGPGKSGVPLSLSGPAAQTATIFKKIADGLTPPRVTLPGGGLNPDQGAPPLLAGAEEP